MLKSSYRTMDFFILFSKKLQNKNQEKILRIIKIGVSK